MENNGAHSIRRTAGQDWLGRIELVPPSSTRTGTRRSTADHQPSPAWPMEGDPTAFIRGTGRRGHWETLHSRCYWVNVGLGDLRRPLVEGGSSLQLGDVAHFSIFALELGCGREEDGRTFLGARNCVNLHVHQRSSMHCRLGHSNCIIPERTGIVPLVSNKGSGSVGNMWMSPALF